MLHTAQSLAPDPARARQLEELERAPADRQYNGVQ
jgi:hypothetical protein